MTATKLLEAKHGSCCWFELLVDVVALFVQSGRLKNNEATGQLNGNNWLVVSNPSLEVRQVVLVGVQWKL